VYDFALQFLQMLVSEFKVNTHGKNTYGKLYLLPNFELDACITNKYQFLSHPAAGCRPDYFEQRCKGK
jgi:hypothetical protein